MAKTDSRRIREGSRIVREDTQEYTADSRMGSQRVHERVRDRFARVRESSREFAKVREGCADGFTTDIRRIRGLTQIRERIHSGFTRALTQCSPFTAVNPFMAFDKSALIYTVACTYNHDD